MVRKLVDKVLAAIIMIVAVACGDSGREIIDKAEDALTVSADSALNVLSGLLEPEKLEDPDLSDYWIATGQAHSNNGTAMTGDSMLCHALEYYSRIAPDSAKRLRALSHGKTPLVERRHRNSVQHARHRFEGMS